MNRREFIALSSLTAAHFACPPLVQSAVRHDRDLPVTIDTLREQFIRPPDATKSSCYWWWFNGLVDEEGITRDLEEFRAKGMGEVLLVNSAGGLAGVPYPQGALFLSPEWKALYRHAMKEAKRLNISVGVNLCSGWCMGGPWIKPKESGRWYLQSELVVKGPKKFSGKLPLPGNRSGYDYVFNPPGFKDYIDLPLEQLDYRDTAVVAILNGGTTQSCISGERAALLPAKTNHKDASNFILAVDAMKPTRQEWQNDPSDTPVPLNHVVNLTARLSADGHLDWQVPPGDWTIIRTGHRMTGSRLMIAQPEADGLSIDWFNRRGVELQFEHLGLILIEEAAKVGNKPRYFCDDSFEDGFPNWTEDILSQFKKYRGYDATPYLPVLAGYLVGSAEISDRFLTDYRKTLADCMADEHYKRFAELCHAKGMLVQNEAAGPSRSGTVCIDGLKNLGRSDLPMGEFWLGPNHEDESTLTVDKPYGTSRLDKGQNKVTKMAACAAHIYGRETVAAEAFTSFRHWLDYPGSLKQALDRAFCEGVNRIAIHTSTASRPRDGKPGYEYGAGTHFNPNVTWWEKSGAFFDYVARCQYLLRAGKFVADVLFYNGDAAPNLVEQKHVDPALGKGYDYDVCNEEVVLTRLSVRNNRLFLPDGMSYRVLVLPVHTRMPLAVLQKISSLVKAGATVIGPRPLQDSGLKDYPQCDKVLQAAAAQLWGKIAGTVTLNRWGKGRVFDGETIRTVLLKDGIEPDFEYTGGEGDLIDFIHRTTDAAEIYFIANRHGKPLASTCTFRAENRVPQLWDPVSGQIREAVYYRSLNGRVEIPLEFEAFQSWFVVFPKNAVAAPAVKTTTNHPRLLRVQELTGPWKVQFDTRWGGPEAAEFPQLQDWSRHPDEKIRNYSGKAVYTRSFTLQTPPADALMYLDLGIVKNIAEVRLNGQSLGILWTAPWRVLISSAARSGENKLEIEVINLWPNRLIGDAALPAEKRLTHTNIPFKPTDPLQPSGLLGPVVIWKEE